MARTGRGATNGRLTKDQLFEALAVREQDYTLPTGGTIRIRGLSAKDGMAVAGRDEEEYDYEEKTDLPIKVEEKKPEENDGKNILKPGEKVKFGK